MLRAVDREIASPDDQNANKEDFGSFKYLGLLFLLVVAFFPERFV
jgi:hypothetical protein